MAKTHPCVSVSSIVVEGLDPDRRQQAQTEIRTLLTPFQQVDLDLIGDISLTVLVTDRMEEHVDRIAREHGTFVRPYRREKECGVAAGITLAAPTGPPFRVTLVLHHEMWAHAGGAAVVDRAYLLGYTFGHALQQGQGATTDSHSQAKTLQTHAQELREIASGLIEAFDADWTAQVLCKGLRLGDGNPVRCSEFLGRQFIDSVQELVEKLCVFAAIDIQLYRATAVGLEDLWPRVGPMLNQTLQMLVHTIALYVGDSDYDVAMDALKQSPGFRAYLLPDTIAICAALAAPDRDARKAQLVAVLKGILARLGLRIEDMPDGRLYVHVSQPEVCLIDGGTLRE